MFIDIWLDWQPRETTGNSCSDCSRNDIPRSVQPPTSMVNNGRVQQCTIRRIGGMD